MAEVHISTTKGRTLEQKRAVVKEITDTLARHFDTNPEYVLITFTESDFDQKAQGGKLYVDHGITG